MNILVTGGAGFIGRQLVKRLIKEGHRVRIFDNLSLGSHAYILDQVRGAEIVKADTRNYSYVKKSLKNINLVYHLATPSSFLMYEKNPIESTLITLHGFLNILEGMKTVGVRKIIYTSTSAVYEGNPLPYREDMILSPPDTKALSKKFTEEIARGYSQRYDMETIGIRPFSVYGPGEETKRGYANIISLFIWAMAKGKRPIVWGNGNQTRDFIYVGDIVEALMRAKEKAIGCDVFNVGTGKETSFNRVIRIINTYLRTNLKPLYVSIPVGIYAHRLLADVTRQENELGFQAGISIEEGIAKTIESSKEAVKKFKILSSCQSYYQRI